MIQASFLFTNAILSIVSSILLMLDISLSLNIKEILIVLSSITSMGSFYTVYHLLKKNDDDLTVNTHYIMDEDEEDLYVPYTLPRSETNMLPQSLSSVLYSVEDESSDKINNL